MSANPWLNHQLIVTPICHQMESFEQEGRCYLWLIPQLQAMRAEKGLKPLAFPKCFYVSAENSILILENMKAQNYDVIEKKLERKL